MPTPTRVSALVAALAAVTLVVSGCASPDGDAGGPPTRATAPTPIDPPLSDRKGSLTTVTGVLAEGVEAGCVLLEADGRILLLLGLRRDTEAMGTRVQVTGRVRRDMATTCQQGVPLQVSSIRRLDP